MFIPDSTTAYKVYEQKNAIQKDHTLGSYFIDEEKFKELSGFKVEPNDIIVSCAGTIGETYVMPNDIREGIINQALMLIRLHLNDIQNFYLLYFDFILKAEAAKESKGTAIKNIPPFDVLKSFLIPIPPLAEQGRILEEVNKLMSFVDSIDVSAKDISSLINSAKSRILDLAIHGKLVPQDANDESASELLKRINPKAIASCDNPHYANIPSSWVCTTMGSIFQHNTGKALNKSASTEGALQPYLTTSNVYWNTFDLSVVKEMRFKESEIEKCTIRKGDLLVCEGGDIGRAAIWDKDYSICIQNHLHRLRPKGDVVPLLYLYFIMFLKLSNNLEGKGIGLQGFSSGLLDKLEVPLPPYNEQIRIVDKIQETFNMLDSIAESLN